MTFDLAARLLVVAHIELKTDFLSSAPKAS